MQALHLISEPKTRDQLGEIIGLKDKDLTEKIKALQQDGRLVSELKFVDPTKSRDRRRYYSFVAQQQSLGLPDRSAE